MDVPCCSRVQSRGLCQDTRSSLETFLVVTTREVLLASNDKIVLQCTGQLLQQSSPSQMPVKLGNPGLECMEEDKSNQMITPTRIRLQTEIS